MTQRAAEKNKTRQKKKGRKEMKRKDDFISDNQKARMFGKVKDNMKQPGGKRLYKGGQGNPGG